MLRVKEQLEKIAIDYFIQAYPVKLKILQHLDKPDFILINETDNKRIGVEVAHLYHDEKEAKILLGISQETTHGIMCASDLIKVLNRLLEKKVNKVNGYSSHDKLFLVIRVASPIFDKSTFDIYENEIICLKSQYNEIWLLLDDNNKQNRWSQLKQIK